jgi:hypothetical protein
MPAIDMTGLDPQVAPMKAIDEVLNDLHGGFINYKEAIGIINAVVCEWKF